MHSNTILKEPHRFLAYNNGISVTAEEIQYAALPEGGKGIRWLKNMQIVNGGQTTASIYHTARKDKADISNVYVQAKFSVVPPEHVDEIVPKISRFANSQNKINEADFFANDQFHVRIEELSRTIWAPSPHGTLRQTKWFYERARGQYLDAKGREITPARKREFEAVHPSSQKFTKTDLAKYENTWNQLPHVVSLGSEKNFREFAIRLQERGQLHVDKAYFERLIAKAILFKRAEKIIQAQNYGGYRANIVTYTLAYLSHRTAQRINLDRIWRNQEISPAIKGAIEVVSDMVWKSITNPPGGRNITEWCKKEQCWELIREEHVDLDQMLIDELIAESVHSAQPDHGMLMQDSSDLEIISQIESVPADTWFEIANWAKQTGNLAPWQRSLSFSLGRLAAKHQTPSIKQAVQGLKILEEARILGFKL